MAEPTPREFERLTSAVDRLTGVMESLPEKLRTEMAETYVRKDVLEPRLGAIEDDVKTHAGYFAWIVRTVGVLIIAALLSTILVQNGVIH